MDIRAARVLVGSVADCYAALGVVHSLWPFIPGEFDDYIATPKDNMYRSIHTAVLGPGNQPVEIQIRTHDMHAHSERGVAAHWRYKEGGRTDQAYERKINQLRALLAPEKQDTAHDFLDRMRVELFQDRVYVLSPKGEIVDVPVGGTPLDFAYQVHTDLGHRTRGAKINGRMVGLDYALKNGETVEIIAAKTPQPSRDWLSPQSGYLASPRNRNKVKAWFRKQDETAEQGRGARHARARDPAPGGERPADARAPGGAQDVERRGSACGDGIGGDQCGAGRRRDSASAAQPGGAARRRRSSRARRRRASRRGRGPGDRAICCRRMPGAANRCRRSPSWVTSRSAAA